MELGRFAVWCSLEGGSLAQAVEAAQRLESLGYSALWQPMALRRDVMVTASLQLAATKRLVVATGIAPIYERAPLVMAAAQRALGERSGVSVSPCASARARARRSAGRCSSSRSLALLWDRVSA